MLSCRGKFKLFQGIQWINSIKVNSSSSSLLSPGKDWPDLTMAGLPWETPGLIYLARDVISDNCRRQEWWPLLWRFDIFLILSSSLSVSPVSPGQSSVLMTSREKCAVAVLATVGREGESVRQKESTYGELASRAGRNGSNHCCHLWPAISRSCTGERTQGNILIFGGILAASSNPQCWY